MWHFLISWRFLLIYCHSAVLKTIDRMRWSLLFGVHLPNPWWIHGWPGILHQVISLLSCSDSIMLCFCDVGFFYRWSGHWKLKWESIVQLKSVRIFKTFIHESIWLFKMIYWCYATFVKRILCPKYFILCLTFIRTISPRCLPVLIPDQ